MREIIEKAEEDKNNRTHQGNFLGTIYLEDYRGTPLFVCNMAMGSGGLMGYLYHCDGRREYLKSGPKEFEYFFSRMKKDRKIYSNVPF